MSNLQTLYVSQLSQIYDAQLKLVESLPKLAAAADSSELTGLIAGFVEEGRAQIERLELIFDSLDLDPQRESCLILESLLTKSRKDVAHWETDLSVLDAALIANLQTIVHVQIAALGSARSFAEVLGHSDDADALEEMLSEKVSADEALLEIAMNGVNQDALRANRSGKFSADVDVDSTRDELDEEDELASRSHI